MTKETWLSEEDYVCSGCGEKFRLWTNFRKHLNNCIFYKFGDTDGEQKS